MQGVYSKENRRCQFCWFFKYLQSSTYASSKGIGLHRTGTGHLLSVLFVCFANTRSTLLINHGDYQWRAVVICSRIHFRIYFATVLWLLLGIVFSKPLLSVLLIFSNLSNSSIPSLSSVVSTVDCCYCCHFSVLFQRNRR